MIGYVYKIIHAQSNIVYVGSTKQPLRKRWASHKASYQRDEQIAIYAHMQKYGFDQFKILLIKQYDVVDSKHLMAFEQLWINRLKPCNKNASFQPLPKQHYKQWYEANKEQFKHYYEANKEQKNQQSKQWYEANKQKLSKVFHCECGRDYTHSNRLGHLASKYHLDRINGTQFDRKAYQAKWQRNRNAYKKELSVLWAMDV